MVSEYLLARRRGLREACREAMKKKSVEPSCAKCKIGYMCELCLGDSEGSDWISQPPINPNSEMPRSPSLW